VKIAVVGAGRVGTAVAVLLSRAGHRIVAVTGRGPTRSRADAHLPGVPVLDPPEAVRAAGVVLIGLPDDLIESAVGELAGVGAWRSGSFVGHMSGARGLDVLAGASSAGAHPFALHPLQTFADVGNALERIPGCSIAVTAADEPTWLVAERLADDLLGESFRLPDELRPLYHAAAVFASNYVVTASGVASDLLAAAGVPDPVRAMYPLQAATLANVSDLGPAQALTGPIVRGDAGTVERNLEALEAHAPQTVAAYVAMGRLATALARRSGRLPEEGAMAVAEVLERWS
jgi:predicted short-subunit dehydrogenase-like oxidoreductase (DUF2520 family)